MNYPEQILPHLRKKLIKSDLSDFYLIHHVELNEGETMRDEVTNFIKTKNICDPTSRIEDLSTSLLGIFKCDYIKIKFTQGSLHFYDYCSPDEQVNVPIYEEDFYLVVNRKFWVIKIDKLHQKQFSYFVNNQPQVATCIIKHTPAKWNYWHFSLRWETSEGQLADLPINQRSSLAKKIGTFARAVIAQFCDDKLLDYSIISEENYLKEAN